MIPQRLAANTAAFVAAVLFGSSVVAVRVAVQEIPPLSLAERAHDPRPARCRRDSQNGGAVASGRRTGELGLFAGVVGRGDRVGHLRLAGLEWRCACTSDSATSLRRRTPSAMSISASNLPNFGEFPFHALR